MTGNIRDVIRSIKNKADLGVRVPSGRITQQLLKLQSLLCITSENYYVSNTLFYIQKNYSNPDISVEEISREIGRQVDYLERLFRNEIGIPIHQYIVLLRIARFNELYLQNQRECLAGLVEEAGFQSYKCFYHHITKLFGVKPEIYVKNLKILDKVGN